MKYARNTYMTWDVLFGKYIKYMYMYLYIYNVCGGFEPPTFYLNFTLVKYTESQYE